MLRKEFGREIKDNEERLDTNIKDIHNPRDYYIKLPGIFSKSDSLRRWFKKSVALQYLLDKLQILSKIFHVG
jgi:hypothetical protein